MSPEADAHGEVITTQTTKFEGSRLSQCGHTSTSIYVCMHTSVPWSQPWDQAKRASQWQAKASQGEPWPAQGSAFYRETYDIIPGPVMSL